MANELCSFTTRLPKKQYDRLLDIVTATDSEVSRSELLRQALDLFFAQLAVCPSMVPGYDPAKDKSARQKSKKSDKRKECKTE